MNFIIVLGTKFYLHNAQVSNGIWFNIQRVALFNAGFSDTI